MVTVSNRNKGPVQGAIYAGRPGPLGNPFKIGLRVSNIVSFHEWFFSGDSKAIAMREYALSLPDDAVLECWCHPKACHATVIATFINLSRGLNR